MAISILGELRDRRHSAPRRPILTVCSCSISSCPQKRRLHEGACYGKDPPLQDKKVVEPRLRGKRPHGAEVHAIDNRPTRLHEPDLLRLATNSCPLACGP
jgi:hypothetical protein